MTNKKIEQIQENHRRKKTQALVVMNETHTLLPEQEEILEREYEGFDILPVPANGWTLEKMNSKIEEISTMELERGKLYLDVVFVSPIPYMMRELTRREIYFTNEYAEQTDLFASFTMTAGKRKSSQTGRLYKLLPRKAGSLYNS